MNITFLFIPYQAWGVTMHTTKDEVLEGMQLKYEVQRHATKYEASKACN